MKLRINRDKAKAAKVRNPARYRLDFNKENTLNRIWSVSMTRSRVILVTIGAVASVAALVWVCIAFTPLHQFMPGALKGDLRAQYLETALRLDSLEQAARVNGQYLESMLAAIKGEVDSIVSPAEFVEFAGGDSLLQSSEGERRFVERYAEEERFNLSVLAPIAAEGMIFASPVPSTATVTAKEVGVVASNGAVMPVSAVYRGTVVGISYDAFGREVIVLQHPNDFVSVYSGLGDVFVRVGSKVAASQRLGHVVADGELKFELWHNGASLEPLDYIPFQ